MAGQKMYEENKDEPFEAMDSKYLYPEWSGLRISVGISKSLKFLHFWPKKNALKDAFSFSHG